ncbi:methionyl-tRNA formyltransferase [Falsarthrobacter nasiphocae]|uniref:Methionyl-tRNA formyltransferase n=1 Tax=Falsarthrobacter nasiphocae TaxID=189863 RepID=A0AAE3YDM0_9MICC|nr:methionyl-tRNA formyltransferase [Falsarthrobacter nasiphocae]MDR6891240.1 methionyl-tRNA formyltransferase [Falsarthrobacter nasiphocae]
MTPRPPLKVLFAGTPANAAAALRLVAERVAEGEVEIVGVLTREDAPVGRKRVLTPSPVAQAAEDLGLPVIKAGRVSAETLADIAGLGADAALVVAYGALLRAEALEALPLGWYNLHYSILPDLRGAAPVQRAIMGGRQEAGATIFRIDEGLDTGPVHAVIRRPLDGTETAGSLLEDLTCDGAAEAAAFLGRLARDPQLARRGEPQPPGVFEYASKLEPAHARLDVAGAAAVADRTARGTMPAPGPWLTFKGERFKVHGVGGLVPNAEAEPLAEPGSIRPHPDGIAVAFSDGWLVLTEVQPFGKKRMRAADWLRGLGSQKSSGRAEAAPETPTDHSEPRFDA